jgi:murein DD-endopeptidase MepM/ murein hydrolase activator NlpD
LHLTGPAALALLAACATGPLPPTPPRDPAPDPAVDPASPTAAPAAPPSAALDAALSAKRLMVPVDGVGPGRIPDWFNAPRGERTHGALDILAPRGTPVLSADAGRVLKLRTNPLGGLTIYALDREERFVYYYAHLDRYRDGLREGATLEQGDVLGYVGTTGNAPDNTPHLHFQLMRYRGSGRWWGGVPVNPLPYLVRQGKKRAP